MASVTVRRNINAIQILIKRVSLFEKFFEKKANVERNRINEKFKKLQKKMYSREFIGQFNPFLS